MAGQDNLKKTIPVGNAGGQNKNSFLNKETIAIRKQGHSQLIDALDRFGSLTLDQLRQIAEKESGSLSVKDATMLKFWEKILSTGSIRHLKVLFSIYGIPTDIKSIHYAEVDEAYRTDDPSKVRDVTPIKMSSKERIEMLQKMIEIEQNREKRK